MILVRAAAAHEDEAKVSKTNMTNRPNRIFSRRSTVGFFMDGTPYVLCSDCLKLLIDSSRSALQTWATKRPKRSEVMIDESRGCGKSTSTTDLTRPGLAVITMTRFESCTDSLMLWVTKIIVCLS